MTPAALATYDRIHSAITAVKDISQLPRWMCENTAHPHKLNKKWNFKDHEFQRGILEDPARDLVVVKVSQVGLSEIQARWVLGMLSIYSPITCIYSMPTLSNAQNFSKERIDPVIERSEVLSSLVRSDVDSATMKRIGASFLHLIGTHGRSAAISIPASILISDELDFSNSRTIQQLESRLGHGDTDKFRRYFSTPTMPGYGISKLYDSSSRGTYAVRHSACGEWVSPMPLGDVVIPVNSGGRAFPIDPDREMNIASLLKAGEIKMLSNLTADDVESKHVHADGTVLLCPKCRKVIGMEDLGDPTRRKWVHEDLDAHRRGYAVKCWDAPRIKTLTAAIRSYINYSNRADFLNFGFGIPFRDEASTISLSALNAAFTLSALSGPMPSAPCYIGVDLGRVSWLVVLRPHNGKMQLIWYEEIKETGSGNLVNTIVDRAITFGASITVIDASPDFSTGLACAERLPGRCFACFYVGDKIGVLGNLEVKESESTIRAYRTRSIDRLVKEVNSGLWEIAVQPEKSVIHNAFASIKKVADVGSTGKKSERWSHDGPDHYLHAANYARLAMEMDGDIQRTSLPMSAVSMSRTQFGKLADPLQVSWIRQPRGNISESF